MNDAPYDPYSAAELQLQDLLGPPKPGVGGMRSDMMGSTGSLKGLGLTKQALERQDFSPQKRRGLGTMSLCSFRLDPYDHLNDDFKSPGEDSDLESLDDYSNGIQTPIDEFENLLASLTTDSIDHTDLRRDYGRGYSALNGLDNNQSPSLTYNSSDRIQPDGSYSWGKSPSYLRSSSRERLSPPYTYSPLRRSPSRERASSPYSYSPQRRSSIKEPSLSYQSSRAPTVGLSKTE